jgi:hypothetical protein
MFLKTNPDQTRDHLAHAFFGLLDQLTPDAPLPGSSFAGLLSRDRVLDEARFAALMKQYATARRSDAVDEPADEEDWCFPCGAD